MLSKWWDGCMHINAEKWRSQAGVLALTKALFSCSHDLGTFTVKLLLALCQSSWPYSSGYRNHPCRAGPCRGKLGRWKKPQCPMGSTHPSCLVSLACFLTSSAVSLCGDQGAPQSGCWWYSSHFHWPYQWIRLTWMKKQAQLAAGHQRLPVALPSAVCGSVSRHFSPP